MQANFFKLNNLNIASSRVSFGNASKSANVQNYAQNPIQAPTYQALQHNATIQTQLNSKADIAKYSDLVANLDQDGRQAANLLLKTGILLNNNSNDKTSTLDNLHNIITNPRAKGLDAKVVLNETVKTLANPFKITQKFGDIPAHLQDAVADYQSQDENKDFNAVKAEQNVKNSGCCVAASIEYNLASQMPAEFARLAEGFSSDKMSATKEISLNSLCENKDDSIWLLDNFKIPYQMKGNDKAVVTVAPDKNAIIRAQIQNSYKDAGERSVVDVLMQSTFMNIGSQQTYNALTDRRIGSFSPDDRGLVEIEKTFTESVIGDKAKTSVTFQDVKTVENKDGSQDAVLVGHTTDANTVKRSLLKSLAQGENVIIGYTEMDEENKVLGGHEITVIGAKLAPDGKLIFVCNDTDDNIDEPIEFNEDYILPRIHHVGLPQNVVDNDKKLASIA